jgi:hypothetical protein
MRDALNVSVLTPTTPSCEPETRVPPRITLAVPLTVSPVAMPKIRRGSYDGGGLLNSH